MSSFGYIASMDRIRTPADIGHAIRYRRKALGWDQSHLAYQVGVSRQWIVDIEKGKPRAELQLVLRAIQVLGMDLEITTTTGNDQRRLPPAQTSAPAIDLDDVVGRHRGASDHWANVLQSPSNPALTYQLKTAGAMQAHQVMDQSKALETLRRPAISHQIPQVDGQKEALAGSPKADTSKRGAKPKGKTK